MYIGIAHQRLSGNFGQTEDNTSADIKCQEDLFLRANQKLLLERAEEKAEKAAKKAAKKVKEATKAEKKAAKIEAKVASHSEFLAKTSAKKFEGGFQAGPASYAVQDDDIEAMAKIAAFQGLTGKESEEEAKAVVLANMKEFIHHSLQVALAEHINGKVANGKILPDNSNYLPVR